MVDDAMLTVKIDNTAPIDLLDLSDSLQSLGRQYVRYLTKHGVKVPDTAKLYVREVRQGSAIFDLVPLLPAAAVIFADAENYNHLIDFVKNIKEVYNFFTGKGAAPKEALTEQDLKNYKAILAPVAKDAGSNMVFSGTFNNSPVVVLNLSSLEANAAQNGLQREIERQQEVHVGGLHEKVVFYWHVLKNKPESVAADRGIIETISPLPVKVVFAEEGLKRSIAYMQDKNPMLTAYVVDVQVETLRGKPALYNILRVHDVIIDE